VRLQKSVVVVIIIERLLLSRGACRPRSCRAIWAMTAHRKEARRGERCGEQGGPYARRSANSCCPWRHPGKDGGGTGTSVLHLRAPVVGTSQRQTRSPAALVWHTSSHHTSRPRGTGMAGLACCGRRAFSVGLEPVTQSCPLQRKRSGLPSVTGGRE